MSMLRSVCDNVLAGVLRNIVGAYLAVYVKQAGGDNGVQAGGCFSTYLGVYKTWKHAMKYIW